MSSLGLSAPNSLHFSFDKGDLPKKLCSELDDFHLEYELAMQKEKIALERLDDMVILMNIDQMFAEIKGFKKELEK